MSELRARRMMVIDADTFELVSELEAYHVIRLPNIDADESHTDMGDEQTEFVKKWMEWEEENFDGKYPFMMKSEGQYFEMGSWGRVLARIVGRASNDDLGSSVLTHFDGVGWNDDREETFENKVTEV